MRLELSIDELTRILAPFDLRPRRVERIEKGTISSNFRVETDGGSVFVRVNAGKREADIRYEGALLWHLGAHRFPAPPPVRTSAGEAFARDVDPATGRALLVTVFPWWPGHEADPDALTAAQAGRVGEILARLHLAAADFPLARHNIYSFERIADRIESFRQRASDVLALAEAMPILDDELAFQRDARRSLATLPAGTIHGDLFPDNLLFAKARVPSQQGGAEEVAAVLDFEQASRGRYVYDLAVALLAWCWSGEAIGDDRAWAMVSGYQRLRPLDEAERDGLIIEARFAALRFTVTRITDVFLPSLPPLSEPERPGKDFREYLARLVFLRRAGDTSFDTALSERPPLRAV